MTQNTRAIALALLAFGFYSTHDVFIKILGASYAPFQIVFFSVLFGFPLVTVQLLRDKTEGTLIPRHPWWTLARTFAAMTSGAAAFYAFSVLPLAQTYAIIFAAPLLITMLAIPMLGERVGFRRSMAVLVGLAGVMVVLNPGTTELTLGHGAALVCAISGAFASIVVRKIGRDERGIVLLIYPLVANFITMGAILPFIYEPMPIEHMGMLFLVAMLALVAAGLLIQAYTIGEAAIIAPMQYSQILWAAAYGALFFEESIDLNTAIGAGIIISSGLYIVLREARGGGSSNTPVLRTRSRLATPATPRLAPFVWRRELPSESAAPTADAPAGLRGIPGRRSGK